MPVNEIEEVLVGVVTVGANGQGYLTKKINIPEGMRNMVLTIDVMDDMGIPWGNLLPEPSPNAQQFFITPYPPQITDESWGHISKVNENSGPLAGDEQVLFKQTAIIGNGDIQDMGYAPCYQQFPNDEVGARPTKTWYTPTLYLTMMIWNAPESTIPVMYSAYIKIKQTKVNRVESTMGRYKEFLEAQCRLLTETAVAIPNGRLTGQTFPMWTHGGIRAELMIDSATAVQYYNRAGANEAEDMVSLATWENRFGSATTMVAFDAPFGDAAIPLPDWVKIFDVAGVTSGPIRQYAPPLKYEDNGNTMML